MSIFLSSDSHFGHANVIKYSNRPYSNVQEMDEALINNWNRVVPSNGTVYHLGDFAFAKIDQIVRILNRLNGTKVMILGNHDKEIINNKKRIFEDVPSVKMIVPAFELRHNNQKVYLHHYACRVWNSSHHGSLHAFGHSHGSLPPHGKSVDVGVDSPWITGKPEYRPFAFEEFKAFLDTQSISVVDHHGE